MKAITVARKPLVGTVAKSVLEHGCGGLNIDDCRTGYADPSDLQATLAKNPGKDGELVTSEVYGKGRPQQQVNVGGRWPANLILQHLEGCQQEGARKIKGHQGYPNGPGGKSDPKHGWGAKRSSEVRPNAWSSRATDSDGNETVAVWDCVEGCPIRDLDEQSGVSKSAPAGVSFKDTPARSWKNTSTEGIRRVEHGDSGGASRFFKAVKP